MVVLISSMESYSNINIPQIKWFGWYSDTAVIILTTMVATCSHSNHVVRKYVLVHTAVDSTSAVSVARVVPPRQYVRNTLNISVDKHQCKKLPVRWNNLWAHSETRVKIICMCFLGYYLFVNYCRVFIDND